MTSRGLKFCGESFNALCRKYGIARHHTLVRTAQQNGVAERMNRTIIEKVRCMLSHANLDKDFLVEAATTTSNLINRFPHRSLDGNIPEILWSDVTINEDVIINSGKDFVPSHNVNNNHTEDHIKNYEPINYLEAISSPECDKWVVTTEGEVVKDGIPGVKSNRYKAWYVVRGFDQRECIDFNEVLSPVVHHTSIRVLLSIVAQQDLRLEQLDVKTSFLHGHLEEEIYVDCKPIPTPLAPYFKLSSHKCPKSEEDKEDVSRVPYSSAVGNLMYAMVCTRLDLAHVVSVVSRYMHNPGKMIGKLLNASFATWKGLVILDYLLRKVVLV
nr:retrovirus-related Pol polyprotein from transposon TNT 1-94 [Tanacetum cinerariifolium]